ncbi:MAG: AAA family ATPase [Polyangiaceae bacterium]|nr:AAA family ATPase [Polyangiaceae bacterium]
MKTQYDVGDCGLLSSDAAGGASTPGHVEDERTLSTRDAFAQGLEPRVYLVIGPVGAGKSTFALGLAKTHRAVRLTLDDWMTTLFAKDRPGSDVTSWYIERADRAVDQIWKVAAAILEVGIDVVLEIGLIRRDDRERFYRRVDAASIALTVFVLDADRATRRRRVEERNDARGATFSMHVPPAIFELASDLWEAPDDAEREARDMRFIRV